MSIIQSVCAFFQFACKALTNRAHGKDRLFFSSEWKNTVEQISEEKCTHWIKCKRHHNNQPTKEQQELCNLKNQEIWYCDYVCACVWWWWSMRLITFGGIIACLHQLASNKIILSCTFRAVLTTMELQARGTCAILPVFILTKSHHKRYSPYVFCDKRST